MYDMWKSKRFFRLMKKIILLIISICLLQGCSAKEHNLKFEVVQLYCFDKGTLSKEIIFTYKIFNNYEKDIKYIDAHVDVRDLFDKKLISYKILRKAFVEANNYKLFKSGKDVTFSEECSKLSDVNFEDLKIKFVVKQIAFEDNSVIKF